MHGAILVHGGTKTARKEGIKHIVENHLELIIDQNNPDILLVDLIENKRSIGIDQTRAIIKFVNEKPYKHKNKAIVIYNANKMTIPAQNSLLKTLEELPSYASILLETQSQNDILKTILSRCQKVQAKKLEKHQDEINEKVSEYPNMEEVLNMKLGERLSWAEECSKEDRELILEMLNSWKTSKSFEIIKFGDKNNQLSNIEKLDTIITDLEKTNVNIRLALEYLVLSIG